MKASIYRVRQANFLFWTERSEGKRKLACRTLYDQLRHGSVCLMFVSLQFLSKTNARLITGSYNETRRWQQNMPILSTQWNHPDDKIIYVITNFIILKYVRNVRIIHKKTLWLVSWVRERIIPTEQPPLVGQVGVNLLWIVGVTWSV
jgi:hypothetical protein